MTAKKKNTTAEHIISLYMDYVLEHDHEPASVYKFCKANDITEQEFYAVAGSFPGLRKEIWNKLFFNAHEVAAKKRRVFKNLAPKIKCSRCCIPFLKC